MKAAGVKEMHVDARRGDRKTGYAYLVATFDMAELTPDSAKDDEPNETKYSGRMVARALRKMFRDWTHVQIRVDLRKIFDWRTAEYTRHEMWMLDVRELMDARKMDPRDNPLHNRELMQEVTKLYGPYPYITNFDQCLVDNKTVFATVLLNF
jgi:hypothetical protein